VLAAALALIAHPLSPLQRLLTLMLLALAVLLVQQDQTVDMQARRVVLAWLYLQHTFKE